MPYSSSEGKEWMRERIVADAPASVLDVGAGWGTYARLLRSELPAAVLTGLEVHSPYITRFGLAALYDMLIIGDVREIEPIPTADVVVLGDVLEHLTYLDAVALWGRTRAAARVAVYLSLPIVAYPQGAVEGNPHEAHLHTWDHDAVLALGGITDFWTGIEIGCYRAAPT
jgi:hypothetical protein